MDSLADRAQRSCRRGWSFNPGEPTGASTAPLWVALLALLFRLRGDVTVWVKALGCLLYLIDVLLVADVARLATGDRRVAVVAGLLAAWQPAFVWGALSGMEVTLYLLLFLLSLRSLLLAEQRGARFAYAGTVWLVMAGWARPELWALLPVIWAYLIWRRREVQAGRLWLHVLIAAVGIGAFALFNLAVWGSPLPATWYAKTAFGRGNEPPGLGDWLLHLSSQVMSSLQAAVYSQNPVLIVTLALGCVAAWRVGGATWRRMVLLLAVTTASVLAAAGADLGAVSLQNYRRAAPLVACLNILAAMGAVALWDALTTGIRSAFPASTPSGAQAPGRQFRPELAVAMGVALLVLAMQLAGLRQGALLYASDVRSINQGDVAAARWLAAHTPPDATVAANDIGAMAYFGGRRIVDLVGLASPDVIDVLTTSRPRSEDRERRLRDLLIARGVDHVVIFPEWFPYLSRDPALVPLQRFSIPDPTALAGDEVVIYGVAAAAE